MRRRIAIVLMFVLLATLLTGCGCSYDNPVDAKPTEAVTGGEGNPTKAPGGENEATPTGELVPTESVTPGEDPELTATVTPELSAAVTPTVEATPTAEPTPTVEVTPTAEPTVTPTKAPTVTLTPTNTPKPTATPTKAPTATLTPTNTPKPTATPTKAPTATLTPTNTPKPTATPTPTPTASASVKNITLNGKSLSIGDTKSSVIATFGSPKRTDTGEGNFSFLVYNGDYKNFLMVAVDSSNTVVGFFVCSKNLAFYGLDSGSDLAAVNSALGTSVTTATSMYKSSGAVQKTKDGVDVNVFIDHNGTGNVYAVECMKTTVTYNAVTGMSEAAILGLEKQVLDMTNAYRVQNGLTALVWSDSAAEMARDYCEIMADYNTLSHSVDGTTLVERFNASGISWRNCGENISSNSVTYGHFYNMGGAASLTAGWIKSSGHRDNILGTFTYLGVGLFGDKTPGGSINSQDYAAQEFYR